MKKSPKPVPQSDVATSRAGGSEFRADEPATEAKFSGKRIDAFTRIYVNKALGAKAAFDAFAHLGKEK